MYQQHGETTMSMMDFVTPALDRIDAYKLGHKKMYPEGTTLVYNNFTPRSEKLSPILPHMRKHEVVVIGVQRFVKLLKALWDTTFFSKPCDEVVSEWEEMIQPLSGAAKYDAGHIEALHKIGYLPLEIKAIREGTSVPFGTPVITIKNTHPDFAWLPGFMEDFVSAELWKPMTTATIAKAYRDLMEKYAEITGGSKDSINWQGHDFSLRGMSGIEDAANTGVGHLLFFTGTDNIPAVRSIQQVYGNGWVYGSVPASEHSVMCAGGKETECDTFERMLDMYPKGVVSIVSDTWDYWSVLTEAIPSLKGKIMSRQEDEYGNCKTVLRPDSGDPVKIICGEEYIVARYQLKKMV
jgi:nicotinamide phosphoribosyltransferase